MSKSREQLNSFIKKIDIEGKIVLDVGSQNHLANRLTEGTAYEYDTLDIDPEWKPNILADLNKKISSKDVGDYYDLVFCIEVLEHCWNPIQAIDNLSRFLKQGGDLYISTPFINPHHDRWDYLRYTGEWYEEVLPKFDLEIVKIEERVATVGKDFLAGFYAAEGLKVSKIRPEYGRYTYPIGYFVHARKR